MGFLHILQEFLVARELILQQQSLKWRVFFFESVVLSGLTFFLFYVSVLRVISTPLLTFYLQRIHLHSFYRLILDSPACEVVEHVYKLGGWVPLVCLVSWFLLFFAVLSRATERRSLGVSLIVLFHQSGIQRRRKRASSAPACFFFLTKKKLEGQGAFTQGELSTPMANWEGSDKPHKEWEERQRR